MVNIIILIETQPIHLHIWENRFNNSFVVFELYLGSQKQQKDSTKLKRNHCTKYSRNMFLLFIFCFHSNTLSTFYYYVSPSKAEKMSRYNVILVALQKWVMWSFSKKEVKMLCYLDIRILNSNVHNAIITDIDAGIVITPHPSLYIDTE